jgi:Holliday junction resolvasome RuvABC endonuclease subunit
MSFFCGIDPGSLGAGLAALDDDGNLQTRHITIRSDLEIPDRFVALRNQARLWLSGLVDDGCWCVVVERPGTRFGGATLMGSYGVLVEAARSVLPCPVLTLASGEWKRHALGNGAAKKADVMAGARLLGYTGGIQDVADAVCIAEAGRVITQRELRRAA